MRSGISRRTEQRRVTMQHVQYVAKGGAYGLDHLTHLLTAFIIGRSYFLSLSSTEHGIFLLYRGQL